MIRTQTLQKINPQVRGSFKENKNSERRNLMGILYPECPCECSNSSHMLTDSTLMSGAV